MFAELLRLRVLTVALVAALTACSQGTDTPDTAAAEPAGSPTPASSAVVAPVDDSTRDLSVDELKKLAALALRNQQLHTPAGANAIEYYLALRQRADKPDAIVESALFDLVPYAVIAAERALTSNDLDTASRLRELIGRVDRTAPSLPRLDQKIAEVQQQQSLEQSLALEAQQAAATTPTQTDVVAAAPAPSKVAANETIAVQTRLPSAATSKKPDEPAVPSVAPSRLASTAPASTAPGEPERPTTSLVAVRTPEPSFPPEALRKRKGGSVEIEFQVGLDGRVSDVRVLNSSQHAFERNVVLTVRRWQFQPLAEPMTVRRNFSFNTPS